MSRWWLLIPLILWLAFGATLLYAADNWQKSVTYSPNPQRTDGTSLTETYMWARIIETTCSEPFTDLVTYRGPYDFFYPSTGTGLQSINQCSCWQIQAIEQLPGGTLLESVRTARTPEVCSAESSGCHQSL